MFAKIGVAAGGASSGRLALRSTSSAARNELFASGRLPMLRNERPSQISPRALCLVSLSGVAITARWKSGIAPSKSASR